MSESVAKPASPPPSPKKAPKGAPKGAPRAVKSSKPPTRAPKSSKDPTRAPKSSKDPTLYVGLFGGLNFDKGSLLSLKGVRMEVIGHLPSSGGHERGMPLVRCSNPPPIEGFNMFRGGAEFLVECMTDPPAAAPCSSERSSKTSSKTSKTSSSKAGRLLWMSKIPCKGGSDCDNKRCGFDHPPGWKHARPKRAPTPAPADPTTSDGDGE